ncbi:MAG: GNAT family N-acetyltransferase [Chloroflexi bacterium]|nr:MAG: GNAT family N-acetyltransferase [Chloroflexota bacterium]
MDNTFYQWLHTFITPAILSHPKNQHLQDDFAFYWDNINAFWQWGLGTCVLHDDAMVSCFSSDAFGIGWQRV